LRKFTIAAITTGVLLLISGLRASDLRWSRAETLTAAESRAANQAVIMSAYLVETFAAGDASMRQLALRSRRIGGPTAAASDWAPSLASAKAGLTSVGAISVVDRHGIIRHSTRPEIVGQSRRDQPLFRTAMNGTGEELLVGTPFVPDIASGGYIIPIGRRLIASDGTVEGLVVGSFLPWTTRGFFNSIDVGRRGALWVFHESGVELFRRPAEGGGANTGRPIFQAASRNRTGVIQAPITRDGPLLVTAYHTSRSPALVTAASLDRDEVLENWTREAYASAQVIGFGVVMSVLGLLVLFRQMDAKAEAERALALAQEREATRLREANDRLAAALQREQIARRDAETASQLKDQFLMTVSHELRTPLTAIMGWARMLVDGAVSERRKEAALRTIDRNAQAQVRLIDDLLDVSRIMSGKLRLDVRTVAIEEIVRQGIATIGPAAEAKRIRVDLTTDESHGRVAGDPERLQQIVWNLLSNAVKFTPERGHVAVSVATKDDEIEIVVRDTGIGIGADFLPHVFERFRQQDSGTTRHYGGLGLGLAIVRSLVELHGGSVSVHSDGENRGAIFMVRLPVSKGPVPDDLSTSDSTQVSSAKEQLTGVRVLLVDDDTAARELFGTVLGMAGATVAATASAPEALAALREGRYDVILSDIEMPGVDGYSLVHDAMRVARSRGDRMVAIAVTAHSGPETEARARAAGFHAHIRKPVDPSALVTVVSRVYESVGVSDLEPSSAIPDDRHGLSGQ
jgi:signal transduction histidine kinase/ActR/RegA family two-component response regulator